jgi:hypothetical protein
MFTSGMNRASKCLQVNTKLESLLNFVQNELMP